MTERRLVVPGRYDRVQEVCQFVAGAAQEAGLDESDVFDCQLAVDEACTNIIEHAYGGDDRGEIGVICDTRDGEIKITLRDQGAPFDSAAVPDPPTITSLEDAKVGGLGVAFIKRLMTSVEYAADGQGNNTVVMIKRRTA